MSDVLRLARRIVVKVGSSLVTDGGRGVDAQAIGHWCGQIALLAREGREVVMVSSGAIAEGMKRLGWAARPKELHELQAAAAVGQMGLAQIYESQMRSFGIGSAQVLLTHADLADRERYLNARSTLLTLLRLKVVPVINENDTVVNDEIKFGDNDTLGALVANLVEADALVILTDQPGFYSADPRRVPDARFIPVATAGAPELERMAGGVGSKIGSGGMITKVLAAKRAASSGASTVIASGREPDVLVRLGRRAIDRYAARCHHAQVGRPQAMDGRSPADARCRPDRRRRSCQVAGRRKEPAARGYDRCDRRIPPRRCDRGAQFCRSGELPEAWRTTRAPKGGSLRADRQARSSARSATRANPK